MGCYGGNIVRPAAAAFENQGGRHARFREFSRIRRFLSEKVGAQNWVACSLELSLSTGIALTGMFHPHVAANRDATSACYTLSVCQSPNHQHIASSHGSHHPPTPANPTSMDCPMPIDTVRYYIGCMDRRVWGGRYIPTQYDNLTRYDVDREDMGGLGGGAHQHEMTIQQGVVHIHVRRD